MARSEAGDRAVSRMYTNAEVLIGLSKTVTLLSTITTVGGEVLQKPEIMLMGLIGVVAGITTLGYGLSLEAPEYNPRAATFSSPQDRGVNP